MTELKESNHPALYYQDMLSDQRRMQRYREAIEAVVRPGDVVADLGTGLGVLAIMAARAGARRVYAVEVRPQVIPLARRVIDGNGLGDRITLVEGDATEIVLPEPVDVILNELIGDFGTDENIYECVAAIAKRHLRPGGRVVPGRLSTHVVGVTYGHEFRGVYGDGFHGMDLRQALADPFTPEPVMHAVHRQPTELTSVYTVEDINFEAELPPRAYQHESCLEVLQTGSLQGFIGYFRCELAPGVTLDNYPCYPGCHWVNWNWPVTPPIEVRRGQRIRGALSMPARTLASCWHWDWSLDGIE